MRDSAARSLGGVSVSWGDASPPSETDKFGRVEAFVVGEATRTLTLTKGNYFPQTLEVHCVKSEEIETDVVLRPSVPGVR